ncbi:MAG: sigma-70 family RNA polymerase sigma factor [Firmicutes bacterium]|nr:sigma-70 family RNA polymerase sigma factor [Bacillota bacterium]
MTQEKDLVLLHKIRFQNDPAAKDELVLKYLPMVRRIVKNYHPSFSDFDDFLQEGAIGLLKAIEEYSSQFPVKFSSFAYLCITRRIYNAVRRNRDKILSTGKLVSLFHNFDETNSRSLIDLIINESDEPFALIEKEWNNQKLDSVLKLYLSPIEYQVIKGIIAGDSQGEIQISLSLPPKVIDNARTRARGKLRRIIEAYGSLLSPDIPGKVRKRKDLSINLEVS